MDDNTNVQNQETENKQDTSTPETILQAQIQTLVNEVKKLNNDLAYAKVDNINKDIELNSLKAILDSNTKSSDKAGTDDYADLIDENDLSAVMMSGNY